MPLDACIAKVGTLSENDIAFLRQEIAEGKTDEEALANFQEQVDQETGALTERIEAAGTKVDREGPAPDYIEKSKTFPVPPQDYQLSEADQVRWDDLKKQVPGLAAVQKWMQPDEIASILSKETGANMVQLLKEFPDFQEMAAVARAGRSKQGWYANSQKAIHEVFGTDAPRFTALLAAFSPRNSVEGNTINALKIWTGWVKAGRPQNTKKILDIMGANVQGTRGVDSVMQAWAINGYRALTAPDASTLSLSGAKANSFMLNLMGHANEVTLDAWMAAYTGFEQQVFAGNPSAPLPGKSAGYIAMNILTRKAGKKAGMRPMEVQETIWSFAKTLMEKTQKASETRTALEILNEGDLTHEEIRGTVDFEKLFLVGEYREVLEAGGYGPELRRAQSNVDRRAESDAIGPVFNAADKAQLNRTAKRIDALIVKRKAASARAEIQVNLSAATGEIPGLAALQDAANVGDPRAHRLLQDVATDSLNYLLGGIKSANIETTRAGGLYGGELEPAVGLAVSFKEADRAKTLSMLAKFANNFRQEEVHVREEYTGKEDFGTDLGDGSFVTSVINFPLDTPLARDEAERVIDESGLPGLTITDEYLEVYFAGDPANEKEIAEHVAAVKAATVALGARSRGAVESRSRIWRYGNSEGAIGYGNIAGNFRPPKTDQANATAQRVASRVARRPVTPQELAEGLDQQQAIAQAYEEMPVNDLANPDVQRAYSELAFEVLEQYDALTIVPEAWPSTTEEPYTKKGQVDSKLMRNDVLVNNHLYFYKTTPESFGPPGEDVSGHPLLQDSGRTLEDGTPLLYNDLFRVVHDYYAHTMSTVGFGPKGEETAWRNHMMMTKSPWAKWAMTSETRGQNSWVNGRPEVQDLPLRERGFASQKTGLLPVEFLQTGETDIDWNLGDLPGSEQLNLAEPPGPIDQSLIETPGLHGTQAQKAKQLEKLGVENEALIQPILDRIDKKFGTESKVNHKLPERVVEKANRPGVLVNKPWHDVEHVRDAFRFKTVLSDFNNLPEIIGILNDQGIQIVKGDTAKQLEPASWGWRISAFDLRMPNGQIIEWYLPVEEMEFAKDEGGGHLLFEQWRNVDWDSLTPEQITDGPKKTEQESRDLYGAAWQAFLERTDQTATDIAPSLAKASALELSSTDLKSLYRSPTLMPVTTRQSPAASRTNVRPPSATTTVSPSKDSKTIPNITSTSTDSVAETGAKGQFFSQQATPEEIVQQRDLADKTGDRKSRVGMEHKEVLKRVEALKVAAQDLQAGTITKAEHNDIVNQEKPIGSYESLPTPASTADMMRALHTNKQTKVNVEIDEGHQVGLRLDIPAYKDHNVWVPTIHENEKGKGKGPMSHRSYAVIENAEFPEDKHAVKVAAGGAKAPSAVIKGAWVNQDKESAMAEAQAALEDPAWVQVGFDPERHSYFFDRDSTMPVMSGSKVIQVGGLVLVKDPVFGSKADYLFQDQEKDRGRFYPDVGGKRIIQLTEASDLSTFLHESGHLFLDIQRIWAEKYGMNENQQAMLDWLGVDKFEDITTEGHETWAETFEVYLREGKAPSVGLRRAFQSFASWLKRIYRTLQNPRLTRAKLDPEITEIFDKMLATQTEIDLAKIQPEYAELFQSQEQAGMTDAQWAKYKTNATRKNETAEAAVDAKVMKQYKHMKSEEWAEEKAPLIKQEAERLAKEPIYQVMSDMTAIKDENGEIVSDGRVDWHKLRDAIDAWPNGKNWIGKAVGGGVDPGLYADAYEQFASVKDMYEQVRKSDTLNQASDKAAEQIMVAKYGDILNDGTLEQEVREAMLNEEQAAMLLAELKASGAPAAKKIDRKMLKYQADQLIGTYTYKQIRPSKFYNQMIKAAQAAAKAEDPTADKIQQLANHYLYKAAMDAKEQMDRGRKQVRGVQNRKYNPLQVDQQYIEAMKSLASAYDIRLTPLERDEFARRVLDFYEGQTNPENENSELFGLEMLDPNLQAAIQYRHENGTLEGFQIQTFDEMTVAEMKGVTNMLDHLRYVGGQVANKGNLEAAAVREAGLESIEEHGGKDSSVQRGKQRAFKMTKLTWGDMVNSLPSLGNMVRKLDGFKDGGWAFENIYKPINEAISRKLELQQQMFKELEGFMSDMSAVGLKENDAMPITKEDGTTDDFTSSEVFMMAVYWGTESSRQSLMEGHALSEGDVQQLMGRLTPRQLSLVNQVWAMNESQWPQLQEAAKAMLGIAPAKLEATSFEVNGVEMTGGHMQLMYDSQALELADEQQRGMNTANVVPMQAGSTHARKGSGGKPVLLDTRNITQSVEEKTHYIAFAETGRYLRSILNNKEIQNKIEKKHGAPFYENMLHSITAISRAEPAKETSKWLARLSRHMRGSATMMHLAYSIRNVSQQFSAIPIAAREVGVLKWAQAMGHYGSRPLEVMAMVDEKSKFMENRKQVVNREAREYMKKVMATSKGKEMWNNIKSRGFILQTLVDSTVAYPTWYARYTTAMDTHGDEKRAVIEADQSVAESVGSGSDLHLGRIMQTDQNEFVKTLTVFGSWFNAYYQRLYKSSKGGTDFLSGAFLMDGLIMPIIAANLAQVLIMDIPDDEEEVPGWLAENSFKFMLGTVPLVRDIASAWEGFTPSMPISAVATAPVRIKTEIESYAKGNQSGLKLAADIGRTVGSVMPLPGSGNLWRFLDYTDSYLEGKEGKDFNIYQALAEGRDKN